MDAPRWVVIVPQGQSELYDLLRKCLKETNLIEVVFDRRAVERRRGGNASRSDRRRDDRRGRARASAALYHAGLLDAEKRGTHAPVLAATPARVPRAAALGTVVCPSCGEELEFDAPQIAPSARLELEVIHQQQSPSRIQHFVETQAFTPSGRPLMASRLVASRKGSSRPT